jgi:NAD(P) transhydrogenase subunit beta
VSAELVRGTIVPLIYLVSATLFMFGLKRLAKVRTARSGNRLAAVAMLLAVAGTLLEMGVVDYTWILVGTIVGGLIGVIVAVRVEMTSMPEMVALFNGFGGAASALVALSVFWRQVVENQNTELAPMSAIAGGLSILIGAITLTGSLMAFLKLQGKPNKGAPVLLPARHLINAVLLLGAFGAVGYFGFYAPDVATVTNGILAVTGASLLLGILLVLPIGGADMPVVVSLLNSYSGIAAAAAGFVIGNPLLIIAGAMVGAAGLILTRIMCVAMNRSLLNVLVGGFGQDSSGPEGSQDYEGVTSSGAEEAAMMLETAESVIIVPGYGLAVAQAQHAVREVADLLEKRHTKVSYAIHPVAGRMPGHMNVLLAEADVPYEQLFELERINGEFKRTDVVFVVGANDVVNPAANDDPASPIYGMPILNVAEARTVFVIKRSLSPGYAGVKNTLFERDNTMMIFGDAKDVLQKLATEIDEL